jgi:hypothetical protein
MNLNLFQTMNFLKALPKNWHERFMTLERTATTQSSSMMCNSGRQEDKAEATEYREEGWPVIQCRLQYSTDSNIRRYMDLPFSNQLILSSLWGALGLSSSKHVSCRRLPVLPSPSHPLMMQWSWVDSRHMGLTSWMQVHLSLLSTYWRLIGPGAKQCSRSRMLSRNCDSL